MNNYERLEHIAGNVPIIYRDDMPKGLDGAYVDGSIYMRNGMHHYNAVEVLAEEIGHHYTTTGDITDYNNISNMKQELKARRFGYELIVTLDDIVDAFKAAIGTVHELAEYFNVTVEYIYNAIEHYRMKYGEFTYHESYLIFFYPNLRVLELKKL